MQDDFRGMRMDARQMELLVTKTIHEQLLYNGYFYGVLLVLMVVGGAIVWFAAPYLKSREQAFATKADFEHLIMQLKKITATTETIRAVISLENWEMKEHKALRRLKLEELVLAIHECEHWLSQHANYRLFGQDTVLSADPVAKAKTVAALYFPELKEMLEFNVVYSKFKVWHVDIYRAKLAAEKAGDLVAFSAVMKRVTDEFPGYYDALTAATSKVEKHAQQLMQGLIPT